MNHSQQPRPTFAEGFPRDARLDALVEAFARGDYAYVREAGVRLAREAEDEPVRAAARTLVERTSPDRLTRVLLTLAAILLLALSAWWTTHASRPPSNVPSKAPPFGPSE